MLREKILDPRSILASPWIYLLWQRPFIKQKLVPFFDSNSVADSENVLDIGCGPATSRKFFRTENYVGIDIEPSYIDWAVANSNGTFLVQDATQLNLDRKFSKIIANSLLHHLSDKEVVDMLQRTRDHLAADGTFHVIDLVLPEDNSIPRFLATRDRGKYARTKKDLLNVVSEIYSIDLIKDFSLTLLSIPCWDMIYLRGIGACR